MRAAAALLEQLAQSDVTVLIEGETGTGKEVAAEALHGRSPRARGPFVVFDCAAVQPSLLAAELFGSERGAFTGADKGRPGLLEEADGGTLFIDEVGELPLEAQPALLRVIERKRARRVGGERELDHDVRVVAATNRNLAEEVRAGRFREDLYYRLAVARVRLPPLRERAEDLLHLIDLFAAESGARLTPELRSLCLQHPWPGNVRELRHALTAMAAQPQASGTILSSRAAHVSASADGGMLGDALFDGDGRLRPLPDARRLAGDEFERRYLAAALDRAEGQLRLAAELSGVSRRFIARLVAKHRLRTRDE
jgi:DNA-binding NtrC family response regulator